MDDETRTWEHGLVRGNKKDEEGRLSSSAGGMSRATGSCFSGLEMSEEALLDPTLCKWDDCHP